jgi:UDP-N-acetylmuramoylalanine--D-glutamate ligase
MEVNKIMVVQQYTITLSEIKKDPNLKQVILLSPSAASFDQYKNFEDRGNTFKQLVKKYS